MVCQRVIVTAGRIEALMAGCGTAGRVLERVSGRSTFLVFYTFVEWQDPIPIDPSCASWLGGTISARIFRWPCVQCRWRSTKASFENAQRYIWAMLEAGQWTQALDSESVLFHLTRDLWCLSLELGSCAMGKTREETILMIMDLVFCL